MFYLFINIYLIGIANAFIVNNNYITCFDQSQCLDVLSEYNPCTNMYKLCFDWSQCKYTSFQKICNANIAGYTTCVSKWGQGQCLNYIDALKESTCFYTNPNSNVYLALPGCNSGNQYFETNLTTFDSKCIDNENNDVEHFYEYGSFHDCANVDNYCLWNIKIPLPPPNINCPNMCGIEQYTRYMTDGSIVCLPLSLGLGVNTV